MTDITNEIFEKYEVRKTKKQKMQFFDFLQATARNEGYSVTSERIDKNGHNIVVGSPANAKVIYTAHYDTPAASFFPNIITPKSIPLYLLYQILISVILFTIPALLIIWVPDLILSHSTSAFWPIFSILSGYSLIVIECYLLTSGPANKHNANDNTSGVMTLIHIMKSMPAEARNQVAFIFFDLEEKGCIGSSAYRKAHKKALKDVPVINFDCVSDGNNILFAVNKKAARFKESLQKAFVSNDKYTVEVATKGAFYPSDHKNFATGIGVGALNKSKLGILYNNKIHTKNDVVYDEENIIFLAEGAIRLTEVLNITTAKEATIDEATETEAVVQSPKSVTEEITQDTFEATPEAIEETETSSDTAPESVEEAGINSETPSEIAEEAETSSDTAPESVEEAEINSETSSEIVEETETSSDTVLVTEE